MIINRPNAFTLSRIQAEGQKDGERNIPEVGSYTPAQFEQALIARGEQEVQRRYEKASLRITKLQSLFQSCQQHFDDIESRVKGLVERYTARQKIAGAQQALDAKLALAAGKSLVNYGFYIGATEHNVGQLQNARRTPGIKRQRAPDHYA